MTKPCDCPTCRCDRGETPAIPETGDFIRHDFAAWPPQSPTVNGADLRGVTRITLDQSGSERIARIKLDMELWPGRAGPFVVEGYFVNERDMADFREWRETQGARVEPIKVEVTT